MGIYVLFSLRYGITMACRGDFNVILSEKEKYGGRLVYLSEVEDFAQCVDTCALYDLGFKRSLYTWNERSDDDCIFKRLDKLLANQQFQDLFPVPKLSI